MVDLNKMIGNIKRIHNISQKNERTLDAMIVDYEYNPNLPIYRQHKIDYVTVDGIVGNIFVSNSTTYSDIEVDESTIKYLALIKESILRKKEAHKIYKQETINIENLVANLLKKDSVFSNEDFENKLTSILKDKSIDLSCATKHHGKTMLSYQLNLNTSIEITIKKHFISSIRVCAYKNTNKSIRDLDFIKKRNTNSDKYIKVYFTTTINEDKYNEFIKDYLVLDSSNINLINLIESNNLCLNSRNYLYESKKNNKIWFESVDMIESKNKDDIILLNNDTINMILNILDFIEK